MKEQTFRNLIALLVVGAIFAVLAGGLLIGLAGSAGSAEILGALCSIGFLFVVFVAWEVLMKPGYLFRVRRFDRREDEGEGTPPEEPPSSGSP